jgi:dCTP deaminase
MAFWSTQRVRDEQTKLGNLVSNFNPEKVQQGAYELALSREVITTPSDRTRSDGVGKVLEIPPGQFALLYTQEVVTIPSNVIAFISIKARFKADGLVNISGFHVDPGFSARLKFSVYNAGNHPIFLEYEKETFLIWFSDLDQPTIDPYDKTHRHHDQSRITPEDRQRMSEPSSSPAALDQRLKRVEQKIVWVFAACSAVAVCILLPSLKDWLNRSSSAQSANSAAGSPPPASMEGGQSVPTSTPQNASVPPKTTVQPTSTTVPSQTPRSSVIVSPSKAPQH